MSVLVDETTTPSSFGRAGGRAWLLAGGVFVLVGLLVAAGALWVAGGQRRVDNVASFARAPVGCDTTLDFERVGEFILFVETTGVVQQLAGECNADLDYDRDPGISTDPELTLVDPDGSEVDLVATDSTNSYDVGGFVGTEFKTVQIDVPGDHVITVAPTSGDTFAIAVGRSPDDGVMLLRWGAVGVAIAAFVFGGLFLVLASRRHDDEPDPVGPWTPVVDAWPSGPPGFPAPPPTTGASAPAGPPSRSTQVQASPQALAPHGSSWGPPRATPCSGSTVQ